VNFKGVGNFIFGGNGSFVEQGLWDGKPAWHYVDDRPEPAMFAAGGWRTLYTLFQMVSDGVLDEFRPMGNGQMIGKSFYARPHEIMPDKWRTPQATNYFMLFQVRAWSAWSIRLCCLVVPPRAGRGYPLPGGAGFGVSRRAGFGVCDAAGRACGWCNG